MKVFLSRYFRTIYILSFSFNITTLLILFTWHPHDGIILQITSWILFFGIYLQAFICVISPFSIAFGIIDANFLVRYVSYFCFIWQCQLAEILHYEYLGALNFGGKIILKIHKVKSLPFQLLPELQIRIPLFAGKRQTANKNFLICRKTINRK